MHEGGLPSQTIASAFGEELGPIIGTNFLQRFLATIDGPGGRLLLSPRGDAKVREEDATWANFGDWGGIRVDGLISCGFPKHAPWTLDFDRHRFLTSHHVA